MSRATWTREQLLSALSLYCRLPFGKMHSRNAAIVALSRTIGRTPSAVALKLVNFASLDPEHQRRGVRGMGNTSAADREIWTEYYGNWEALASAAGITETSERGAVHVEHPVPHAGGSSDIREVRVRRGQAFFRAAVLAAYANRCCVTGISHPELLRASHIIPWSKREDTRLDPRNGLCLNSLHDSAFDRGLITFDEAGRLVLSKQLRQCMPPSVFAEMFASHEGARVTSPERFSPKSEMLEYHRSIVFKR